MCCSVVPTSPCSSLCVTHPMHQLLVIYSAWAECGDIAMCGGTAKCGDIAKCEELSVEI